MDSGCRIIRGTVRKADPFDCGSEDTAAEEGEEGLFNIYYDDLSSRYCYNYYSSYYSSVLLPLF